jgi:uncharacterized protein (DUF2062 family)
MIRLTRSLVRKSLNHLLHVEDTPERTAAAFALGVFFGFSPLLGFHTILAIVMAFLLNLNRVAVLLGVYSNLPWFLAPYYAIATMVGSELTGRRPPADFRSQLGRLFELSLFHEEFWRRLGTVMRPLFWPYMIGSLFCAGVLAAAAYHIALAFVESRRRLHDIIHHKHH